MKTEDIDRFIKRLQELNVDEKRRRAALATLRRGLGGETADIMPTFRYLGYYLPPYQADQDTCILIAALFARHPKEGGEGNMGEHLANLVKADRDRVKAAERRFTTLVAAHREDLPRHLRQAVSLLASDNIPINWFQLLKDVNWWNHEEQFVQRNWANSFWRTPEVAEALSKSQ